MVSTGQDLRWLREHPQMLFPHGAYADHWHTLVQQRGQHRYYHEHNLSMLLLGPRRRINGNYSFGPSKELTWRDRSGLTRYTPLVDWSAEARQLAQNHEMLTRPRDVIERANGVLH